MVLWAIVYRRRDAGLISRVGQMFSFSANICSRVVCCSTMILVKMTNAYFDFNLIISFTASIWWIIDKIVLPNVCKLGTYLSGNGIFLWTQTAISFNFTF